jgi:predicted TIM-barrel fold metal-dependent hydrolase
LTGPWNTAAPIETYLKRARAAGIAKTVVFAPLHLDYARGNAEVARIVRAHPGRLIGFAIVHADRDAGRIKEMVDRAVRTWGFRGIKIHGHDAHPTREVCEVARAYRLPLLYDVVGETWRIELLASQYPDVDFIVPHLGSFADAWRAHVQVIDQIARWPNVYADSSGVKRFDYLVEAVRRAGPTKLLFGSDGPWLHPALELQKIRLLGLSPAHERLILGGNARRLLDRRRRFPTEPQTRDLARRARQLQPLWSAGSGP